MTIDNLDKYDDFIQVFAFLEKFCKKERKETSIKQSFLRGCQILHPNNTFGIL